MSDFDTDALSWRQKLRALWQVAQFAPKLTVVVIAAGVITAGLEGVGLGFILPVVELVQTSGDPVAEADGIMELFVTGYQILNIPFTLGTVVIGVAIVMAIRYTGSFCISWLKVAIKTHYVRYLQEESFDHALNARVSYYDDEGSDDILNAIITQAKTAGGVINGVISLIQTTLLTCAYLSIAFVLSPMLTIFTIVFLGGVSYMLRNVIEPGYDLGEKVADANEKRQTAAQAGTQGIRDIRIFGIADELREDFSRAVNQFTTARIKLGRNQAALANGYNFVVAVSIFMLIFLALRFADLSLGSLAVFLFAMFRAGPKASQLNQLVYNIENNLPHLIRTQQFIEKLDQYEEPTDAMHETPDTIHQVDFNDVWFSYTEEEQVLTGIDFTLNRGDFIAFVGQSGAGKSTIAALLARMYEPDSGEITANGVPIEEMDIDTWRNRLAVVRQQPFIFNDTLRYNLTIADRNASRAEIDRVCEIARVDEFFDELPNGYDSLLGDDGIRLSGGQKQRVALARALLADAEILVLDEATSDLDTNLEKDVQEAIEQMDREYSIVTIAHRLSTVKNADRIYTIEDGNVSEFGQHDELISQDGTYAELYATQVSG